jgi:stage II sporulation protein D
LHQLYKGLNTDPAVAAAVWETEGEVLTYEGKPIVAYYHSTSGRKTEVPEAVFGASYPYLKSVEASCSTSPMSMWARRIPLSEIEEATGLKGIKEIRVASSTPTGRVGALEIVSNPETTKVDAKDLRRMLGWRRLPSTDFAFEVEGGEMVIEGRGYGHGVGMCQWTAMEMALSGKGYKEILSYFYPGTTLERHAAE